MDIKEFAKILNGKEYGCYLFNKEEIEISKTNGFVIVTGASDDLMEFEGAICDEAGCYDGGKVFFDKNGVLEQDSNCENCIAAIWCDKESKDENGEVIPWTYKTDIPHETFMIYEDGLPYCRGIVFKIEDVK